MTTTQLAYQNPARPLEERVKDLLNRMTLDEKIAQLGCLWSTALVRDDTFDAKYVAAKMPHGTKTRSNAESWLDRTKVQSTRG